MKEMTEKSEGQPEEDEACEDCLSKQRIVDVLSELWISYGDRYAMKSAIADAAHVLGVKLELVRKSVNG